MGKFVYGIFEINLMTGYKRVGLQKCSETDNK
jgi:hypothetical protein